MLKYLEEKVINHCIWDILLFLLVDFCYSSNGLSKDPMSFGVYQTTGLKETLLSWASLSSQVWLACGVVLCCVCCGAIRYLELQMFCFLGMFFLGPLMYLFDLCGKAVRLGFSSTTNVRLKIVLFALKSLHLMFTILLCFWEIKIKTKDKQASKIIQQWQTTKRSSTSPAE